jgi:mannose-6-phosphate isomerase-like protein (cupin superfamily)
MKTDRGDRHEGRLLVLVVALLFQSACATREAEAVGNRGVELYPASRLRQVGDSLARGQTTGHMLGSHETYQYLQIRRTTSGVPEVHDRWADVAIVQSGRGTLLSGGQVQDGHVESPGEHRGGTIVGGTARPVAAGDLIVIPAGVPHQYQIASGDSLRYLTTKVLDRAGH